MYTPIGFFAPQGGYVTDDLLWYVDANEVASYPGSGTTLFDLVGSNDGTISGVCLLHLPNPKEEANKITEVPA
jgi:hypothetical protein